MRRGRFSEAEWEWVREGLRRAEVRPKKYRFGTYRRGSVVSLDGRQWTVYDADAQGSSFTLWLVDVSNRDWIRGVPVDSDRN